MKMKFIALAAIFAAQAMIGSSVFAEDMVKSYVKDSSGAYVTSGSGECVRTSYESDVKPTECGYAAPEVVRVEVVETPTAASVSAKVQEEVVIGASMLFAFDSAALSDDAKAIIDERIERVKGKMKLTSIMKVEGHTDSTGPAEYNQKLSERRAQSVADYILANASRLSAGDIEVVGKGETDPVASNDTKDGRAQNRRVVIFAEGVVSK
jgi:outer membrane protein OmpA-like peptidoglycan-associated protein